MRATIFPIDNPYLIFPLEPKETGITAITFPLPMAWYEGGNGGNGNGGNGEPHPVCEPHAVLTASCEPSAVLTPECEPSAPLM
jgi:hypothetical protein